MPTATPSGTPSTRGAPWGRRSAELDIKTVALSGGAFWMGNDGAYGYPEDGEGPRHRVVLDPFQIAAHCVTNAEYFAFVEATGYRTIAEHVGSSFVFGGFLPHDFAPTRGVAASPWWREVPAASWMQPEGEGSGIEKRMDHPVVHMSWHDAMAFCAWNGTRLPSEAEWEYAARGGRADAPFPWGDDLEPGGEHRMNVFQGSFPAHNTTADGWAGTCPVQAFPPNGFGLFEMTGNVWEWCADWFAADTYGTSPSHNPLGPARGDRRVMRGGSYLCHESYCRRYRVDARSSNTPDSSAGNIGFRVVRGEGADG